MRNITVITGTKPVSNLSPLEKLAAGELLTGPEMASLLSIKGALKLEALGLKHSQGSVYALVKKVLGLKGNKVNVFQQFAAIQQDCTSADGRYWQRSEIIAAIIRSN